MVNWDIDRIEITVNEENIDMGNISLIEHPHGGIISVFNYMNSKKSADTHELVSFYFDEEKNLWNQQGNPLHFTTPIGLFSQVTYLNLMGNLQLMYSSNHKLMQDFSHDYGKTWKGSDAIVEDSVSWKLINRPLFMRMGRVVLPVFDEGVGRSFAYISDDTGKNWFPSVFIEPSDDLLEISSPEDLFSCKMNSPTFVQAGERKILCFMQPEMRDHLLQAISDDFGETWSSALETKIPSGSGGIDAIRLRDSNDHYIPTVLLVHNQKKDDNKFSVNLSISSDTGETWDEIVELDEIGAPYKDISILQTDNNKLHIVYSSKKGVNHLIVHNFTIS